MSRPNTHGDLFSPMLYPNDSVGFEVVIKPYMVSVKLDGVRCIFKNGEMLSRSFKPIESKQLNERFESMKKKSKETGLIYDGELYSTELNFQELMHYIRTEDLSIEGESLPESVKYYCFDALDMTKLDMSAMDRYKSYCEKLTDENIPYVNGLKQDSISTPDQVKETFRHAVENGFEGLILKNPESKYKFGRLTSKSGDGYKFKPYRTYDAKITGVEQSTKVDPTVERKVTELGYHKTSQKKDDRILIEKASAFWVEYEGKPLKVSLAMTDEEKEEVWKNKESYVGKFIEYKGMDVGAKDVPRHPIFKRYRDDKD
jgi:DNA ligase 1